MDLCHVQSDNCQGWSPTIPKGWSPTSLKMVTHQKEVCYRLGIWRLDLNKTCHELYVKCLVKSKMSRMTSNGELRLAK